MTYEAPVIAHDLLYLWLKIAETTGPIALMSASATQCGRRLLPGPEPIRHAVSPDLCRCTTGILAFSRGGPKYVVYRWSVLGSCGQAITNIGNITKIRD